MANVKVFLDPVGNTMNIWWGNPRDSVVSEETASPYTNDVIVKDRGGKPIGLEIIGVFPDELNIVKLFQQYFPIQSNEPFVLEAGRTSRMKKAS